MTHTGCGCGGQQGAMGLSLILVMVGRWGRVGEFLHLKVLDLSLEVQQNWVEGQNFEVEVRDFELKDPGFELVVSDFELKDLNFKLKVPNFLNWKLLNLSWKPKFIWIESFFESSNVIKFYVKGISFWAESLGGGSGGGFAETMSGAKGVRHFDLS